MKEFGWKDGCTACGHFYLRATFSEHQYFSGTHFLPQTGPVQIGKWFPVLVSRGETDVCFGLSFPDAWCVSPDSKTQSLNTN